MSSHRSILSRRHFLTVSALTASDFMLEGCRHGMKAFKTGTLTSPPNVPQNSQLTIDVHCHIFNGTDLQIEKFLGNVEFPTWWGKAAGEILQLANWNLAPLGNEEKVKLENLVRTCKAVGSVTKVSDATQRMVIEQRNDGYSRARRAVLEVQQKHMVEAAPQIGTPASPHQSTQDAKQQIFASFAAPDYDTFEQNLSTPPPLTDNMKIELSRPAAPGSAQHATAAASAAAQSFSLKAASKFIVQYFQYRFVSAQDYLNTFTPSALRDVDLMLASMVDYDWWLAQGVSTPTPLETQVEVMALISVLSDGRVHGFAPFCPLREVAARAGFKNKNGEIAKSSLEFVQDAIRDKGCVGVKLYPPMGFAAYGNSSLDDPLKKGRADFWKGGLLPEWASKNISYPNGTIKSLGPRLDEALDDLYTWCVEEQVPILAHTDESNGPSSDYKLLAAAHYWALALTKYPGLRVNFGHLGGLDDSISTAALPSTSQEFVGMFGTAASPAVYGDTAYSSSILLNKSGFDERIQMAYEQAASGRSQLPSHLMYGTDWSLLEMVGNNEVYMQRFLELFTRMSGAACARHSVEECFFGWNAVDYLGLRTQTAAQNARARLDSFYARHCMPEPMWMQKLADG